MGVVLLVKRQKMGANERDKALLAENLMNAHQSLWQVLTTADKVLMLVIALAAAGFFFYQREESREGHQVRLEAAGQVHILSFDKATNIKVTGPLGISHIEIGTEGARFSESPCFHKVCVKHGWIRFAGEVAACIPNKMVLAVQGEALTDGLDAVSR